MALEICLFQLLARFTAVMTSNWFYSSPSRTAVPMLEELLSPAFQQDAVVVTETGLFGTAKDATQITIVMKWGPPQRPTSIKPPLHPSTPGNVALRSLSVLWRPWLGNRVVSSFPWKLPSLWATLSPLRCAHLIQLHEPSARQLTFHNVAVMMF